MILIACASTKRPYRARAEDLYRSPLFTSNLRYARSLKPDNIFVLSAKHGLLDLETEIEPYDLTVKRMTAAQVRTWADKVIGQLTTKANLQHDHFVILAGERYRRYLVPRLASYEVPLRGLTIGQQLHYLKNQT